jgi:hypothetical protein
MPHKPLGHNGGPSLSDIWQPSDEEGKAWRLYCWKQALKVINKPRPIEVVRMIDKSAKEVGLTYKEYNSEIIFRGEWLDNIKHAERIREIKYNRK